LACGRDHGIMLYGAAHCIDGTNGDAVMISPPLTVTKEQIDEIMEYTDGVLGEVFATLG
jgi:adenosylmethionine-8-amino-7-oxononanoate aminotransferase